MAKETKDNTEEIMKNEKMVNISFNPKQVLKRLMLIILVVFWIISVAKPGLLSGLVNKAKEKKVEVTTNKEIVMIERSSMYIAMFDDATYVASEDLAGLAEKLGEATGKSFAAEGEKLKMIDGGMLTTVDIAVYRK